MFDVKQTHWNVFIYIYFLTIGNQKSNKAHLKFV